MTRHVVVPALIAAGIGVCAFLIGYAMILAGQAMSAQASPLPPGVEYSPPTSACHYDEVPLLWHSDLVCLGRDGNVRPA
jgi:hypothetical protein